MALPLIMAGLSLLPKIPDMWAAVAGLFGKKVPKGVEEAGNLASEVMGIFNKNQIAPETRVKLEEIMITHKEEMARIALEEKELEYKDKKLDYDDLMDIRDLEKESYKSEDPYVRQTRPKVLRRMFNLCCVYAFFAPACVIVLSLIVQTPQEPGTTAAITATTVNTVVGMLEWIGGWLFSIFGTSYLGYAGARTADKKNPDFKNGSGILNKIVKKVI